MSERRRILLLINDKARDNERGLEAVRLLEACGFELVRPKTTSVEDMLGAIRTLAGEVDTIVIGGGDGSISVAAPALLESGRPLGILPLGTANDLARTLDIPLEIDEAVAVIAHGRPRRIDVGFLDGRPFFNAVNIGLGAVVALRHGGAEKKRWGIWNYPRVIWLSWRHRRMRRTRITCDGRRSIGRFLHIAVVNGRYHGGGIPAAFDATIDDGLLHLYGIKAQTLIGFLRLIPSILRGRGTGPELTRMAGLRFRIETSRPSPVTADGEDRGTTPVEVECRSRLLDVLVPR
ncbi:MAG: YegS/Rv2252/BmrU family lipid kinase [Geminicoccaceae bacterium]|nr:YegS/Rv2252/BmrU family lipid kinase [Geminicoccaceae bacterium]